jgi:hypothetical protein
LDLASDFLARYREALKEACRYDLGDYSFKGMSAKAKAKARNLAAGRAVAWSQAVEVVDPVNGFARWSAVRDEVQESYR